MAAVNRHELFAGLWYEAVRVGEDSVLGVDRLWDYWFPTSSTG
jgi:hypothetical protein